MKQVFYDPQRKRWKRFRRVLDVTAVALDVVLIAFFVSVLRRQASTRAVAALAESGITRHCGRPNKKAAQRPTHRRTHRAASEMALNQDEGLRAAFFFNLMRRATRL